MLHVNRISIGLAIAGLSLSLAACSDSAAPDDASAAATSAPETEQSSSENPDNGDSNLAVIKAMIEAGKSGLLYYSGEDLEANPSDLVAKTGWQGPTSTPTPPAGKKVAIIICVRGSACETAAVGAAEAAEAIGWDYELIDAQATPASYEAAMRQALAGDFDGIITTAIPEPVISEQLQQANDRGIPVIGMAEIPTDGPGGKFSTHVPFRETLGAMLEAWYAIADSDGSAKATYLWDTGYPHLQEALDASLRVMAECPGCEVIGVETKTTAAFANPVEIAAAAASIAQRNAGENSYMMTAYDLGIPAIAESVQSVGGGVKIMTKNASAQAFDQIAKGSVLMDSGTSAVWAGYASIDQMIRILDGQEPLPWWEQGLPVHIFDKSNLPADGIFDWKSQIDFVAEYYKLWGVKN
jgi:ribose transport system substrate-binding protein